MPSIDSSPEARSGGNKMERDGKSHFEILNAETKEENASFEKVYEHPGEGGLVTARSKDRGRFFLISMLKVRFPNGPPGN
jgi:hypothetical protein